jgi:CBS domain-containing protein
VAREWRKKHRRLGEKPQQAEEACAETTQIMAVNRAANAGPWQDKCTSEGTGSKDRPCKMDGRSTEMKVRDIMASAPASCYMDTNLATAVEILWSRNCGILPVLNGEQRVVGVVTDRDICIALGTKNRPAGEITAGEIASGNVFACTPDDDVHTALSVMAQGKVRRLPVIGSEGTLKGLLSMDDIVLHSGTGKGEIPYHEIVAILKTLYQPAAPEMVRRKETAA